MPKDIISNYFVLKLSIVCTHNTGSSPEFGVFLSVLEGFISQC